MPNKGEPIEQLKGWAKTLPKTDALGDLVSAQGAEDRETKGFLTQCAQAAASLQRAGEAFAQARGKENGWELGAIGYGKLLAFYRLGHVNDQDFRKWRKFFGY